METQLFKNNQQMRQKVKFKNYKILRKMNKLKSNNKIENILINYIQTKIILWIKYALKKYCKTLISKTFKYLFQNPV